MNYDRITQKLSILADAAKYDVSCASSGSKRDNKEKKLGNTTGMGICHSYTEDGRCVSLLKILLTNYCIFDCAYCVSRRSNDIQRAAFTVEEVVDLTINFYRRNYIEGLFLSSGIFKNADYTMERLIRIAKTLREDHRFNGYIHLKTIPGASEELIREAGLYADRLSVNIEIPTEEGLKKLAPEKKRVDMTTPMRHISTGIVASKEERKTLKSAPVFSPAGLSSQMVIGATGESDWDIMQTADALYKHFHLKRVHYSGYVPISNDSRLPGIGAPVPMLREHRLYQTDWLIRVYGFDMKEILNAGNKHLDLDLDPKAGWALRNLHLFPVDVNKADREMLLRVPGMGHKSVDKIVEARRFRPLTFDHLKQMGVILSRARYFLTCHEKNAALRQTQAGSTQLRKILLQQTHSKYQAVWTPQLSLFQDAPVVAAPPANAADLQTLFATAL
ncbi:MAG TPA: putative DNA modification/repair radical SAM protein [Saprospiraceae bacterium]|nr:putative DNA modification/repair radical SAM protein [Saprospiraceae bacterium]